MARTWDYRGNKPLDSKFLLLDNHLDGLYYYCYYYYLDWSYLCPVFFCANIFFVVGKWQAHIVFSYLRLLLGKVLWCKRWQLFFFFNSSCLGGLEEKKNHSSSLKYSICNIYRSHGKWVIKPGEFNTWLFEFQVL